MTAIKLDAEVLRNEEITEDIFRLTLMAPEIAEAAMAGQFVMVRASNDLGPPLLRRPFSIHQAAADGRIRILFKAVGKGTRFLSGLRTGDTLSLVGPLGRGFRPPNQSESICLVGGGMGIAPLFYLAQQILLASPQPKDIKVLLGAATAEELAVLLADFAALGVNVFAATDDGSLGHHGLVTDLLRDNLNHDIPWHVYSCGPHLMMGAISRYCADQQWPCQVSLESLMACGISACLGCAIRGAQPAANSGRPYLHVCKDGPVFEAGEVAW
jgi:dihydroorotate dehydrogenase electron transfer subunit